MATASNALIPTLKLILISIGVLFIAILLTPQIFNLPAIWSSLRSWLRPPYLYVIINGIIITIAASSRIHHHYMHPHSAASSTADAEEFRHIHHHDESFRSSDAVSVDAYSNAEPKAPIISVPDPEISTGFSFSFGAVNLENHGTAEVFAYDETTMFGAREIKSVEHDVDEEEDKAVEAKDHVLKKLRNYDLDSVDGGSAEPELEARRSVRTTPSPQPQPVPLARQETFEIVSSFFQSQMEKPSPPSRIGQNRKPSTLTSLDETATFGGRESGGVKLEKVENYDIAPTKTPSPPPRTAPLARQETSEIVSSFFQSQMEEPSPPTRFGQNRRLSRATQENTLTSLDETATFGGVNEVIKVEKSVKSYNITPQTTPSLPPPLVPLARQETSEIVSSFFQSQIEKPPPSARFGRNRKTTRSTPEGGKALRVAKPKRSETLESAWKTITEGRHMPLTRHLKKSDTWDNHSRQPASSDPSTPSLVKKSGTFSDRTNRSTVAAAKLKKDPSLSQEELNRRVESFINKVNEDMRLQRQKSMQQYMDMINRGAH